MNSLPIHQQHHPTLHVVSLSEWPQKPINNGVIRLSPFSSRVFANSSVKFKQLLPVSIADFSGTSIIDQKNIDELVHRYIKHNKKRLQLLNKLQIHRNLYKHHCNSLKMKNPDRRPFCEEQETYYHKSRLAFLSGQGQKKNLHTPRKQEIIIKEKISRKRSAPQQQSGMRWPKDIQNDRTNKKNHHKEQLTKKSPEFHNNTTIKSSKNIKSSKQKKKSLKSGLSCISNKKLGSSLSNLSIRLRDQSEQRRRKEKRADYFGSPCSSKKTKLNVRNSKKVNAYSNQDLGHSYDQNLTQRSNIISEYYNSSTKMLSKQTQIHQYFAPIINQLQQAINELIMITESQQGEILMLENLCSKDDRKVTEKQRRRLNKIHNIEREQLKNYIYSVRQKIKRMRKNKNGMEMVVTL